ncbi:MAG: ABC transporter ATP-binding protein [Sneathiellales bacterium]|nr:ABC transporter ATP-binding protein [Sneathiellales bacterium]
MSGLRLQNGVTVFDGGGQIGPVSLDIPDGQMMALLGPSGSGKTTTLRMIAGLAPLQSGQLYFGAREVTALSGQARNVGMVFQNYGLFPHMTAEENITFGLRMKGQPKSEQREHLAWILEMTRLGGLEKRFPKELSGGQKQRVALARTLITEPDVLLLDEPLSSLDANLREDMALFIKDLQREFNITTIFVTHDQEEAMMLADQVTVMADGAVLQQGLPPEIFDRPLSAKVAEFMGAANIFTGRIQGINLQTPFGNFEALNTEGAEAGKGTLWMVRPEHIRLFREGDKGPGAVIKSARYHGGFIQYEIEAHGFVLKTRQNSDVSFQQGEHVSFQIAPQHFWSFPEQDH